MVPLARQVLVCACVFAVHSFSRHGAHCDGNFERSSDIFYANFARHLFQYLNVTKLGVYLGGKIIDCAEMCIGNFRCFSFNVAANSDAHGHLVCELLASDKYNHSDKLVPHADFHHYSIQVSFFFHHVTLSCSWCQNIIKLCGKCAERKSSFSFCFADSLLWEPLWKRRDLHSFVSWRRFQVRV